MTITTAKRFAALPRLAPLAAALLVALPAQAQWRITPSLSLTETYTDNLLLSNDANKRSEWVTEVTPGIAASLHNSRIDFTGAARSSYFAYSGGDIPGTRTKLSQYDASGRVKVIDEFFYVDAYTHGGTRAVSAFGVRDGNRYSTENSTDVTSWSVSPYLTQRFGNFARATLRYSYDSVDADEIRFGSSTASGVTFDLTSGRAWRDIDWRLHAARQDVNVSQFGDTSSENALASVGYRLNRTFKLTASGGYDSYDYQSLGGRTGGASWSAGFAWAPSSRTSLEVSAGHHYFGKTGSLSAAHRSRHTVWRASYSDEVSTTRSQFTLPQTVDTVSLLDQLFLPTIPDPALRRGAIDEYLLSTGLPPSLTDDVNYLTNRYFRQKLAQASAAFNLRQHSTVLTAFANERTALSTGESDSGLLGSQLFALNDNVRQVGVNAAHSYRLNALTSATASLAVTRSRSLFTDIEQKQNILSLALSKRFSRNMLGRVEARHQQGERGFNRSTYKENSISATLSAQL